MPKVWKYGIFFLFLQSKITIYNLIDMETVKRKRTREEARAAVRETIRRKKEWIEQTNKEFEMIRNGELKLKYS